jgi:uncharacterized protein (DUF1499 family)
MIAAWMAFFDGMLAVTLAAVGILGAHLYWTPTAFFGFQLFVFGFLLSLLGFVLGIIGLLMTMSGPRRVARPRAVIGTVLCLVVALPVLWMFASHRYPAINDITTDFTDPPEYVHAEELTPNQGRDMKYNRDKYMAAQQKGYPPLAPASVPGEPAAVFDRVKTVAAAIPDWQITYIDPKTRTLEGVCTTHLFHFQDDFVIQVRPGPNGTSLVEMRSKSRDGVGDLGVNYHRIVMFLGKLQSAG